MATKSNTEISAILGEWKRLRREGVTQKQFAHDRGLSVRTLREWQRRHGTQEPSPDEVIAKMQVVIDGLMQLQANQLRVLSLRDGDRGVPEHAR